MTTAEFNERLKRVNSKHKLELSFGEYHEELVKDAIMSFWQDKCGFIVEDDTIESLERAVTEECELFAEWSDETLEDLITDLIQLGENFSPYFPVRNYRNTDFDGIF